MQPGQAGGFVEHRNDDRQAQSCRGSSGFGRQVRYVCTQHHSGDLNTGSSILHAQYMGMWRGVAILLELRTSTSRSALSVQRCFKLGKQRIGAVEHIV